MPTLLFFPYEPFVSPGFKELSEDGFILAPLHVADPFTFVAEFYHTRKVQVFNRGVPADYIGCFSFAQKKIVYNNVFRTVIPLYKQLGMTERPGVIAGSQSVGRVLFMLSAVPVKNGPYV